jgi:hypothetical protein
MIFSHTTSSVTKQQLVLTIPTDQIMISKLATNQYYKTLHQVIHECKLIYSLSYSSILMTDITTSIR